MHILAQKASPKKKKKKEKETVPGTSLWKLFIVVDEALNCRLGSDWLNGEMILGVKQPISRVHAYSLFYTALLRFLEQLKLG